MSKVAEMATPRPGAQYERLAIAYEQLANELELLGSNDALRWMSSKQDATPPLPLGKIAPLPVPAMVAL